MLSRTKTWAFAFLLLLPPLAGLPLAAFTLAACALEAEASVWNCLSEWRLEFGGIYSEYFFFSYILFGFQALIAALLVGSATKENGQLSWHLLLLFFLVVEIVFAVIMLVSGDRSTAMLTVLLSVIRMLATSYLLSVHQLWWAVASEASSNHGKAKMLTAANRAVLYLASYPLFGPAIGFVVAMAMEFAWAGLPEGGADIWWGLFTSAYLGGILLALVVGLFAAWQLARRGRSNWAHLIILAAIISLVPAGITGSLGNLKLITMLLAAGLTATIMLRACERLFR